MTDAVVDTGVDVAGRPVEVAALFEVAVGVGEVVADEPEPEDWPLDALGEGETIATGVVALADDTAAGVAAEGDDGVVVELVVLDAVAAVNGSRESRA